MVRIYCEFTTCIYHYMGRDVFGQDAGKPVGLCKCPTLTLKMVGKCKYPVCDSLEFKENKHDK